MKIEGVPFSVVDWNRVIPVEHKGDSGKAIWRTIEIGNIRIRKVEYTPGYIANHWCDRGHVLLVLEGEITTDLRDGRQFRLTAGMSYHVAKRSEPHRSSTKAGTELFIVD
jgi:quercetin dioxygenase-like cupin family protein